MIIEKRKKIICEFKSYEFRMVHTVLVQCTSFQPLGESERGRNIARHLQNLNFPSTRYNVPEGGWFDQPKCNAKIYIFFHLGAVSV